LFLLEKKSYQLRIETGLTMVHQIIVVVIAMLFFGTMKGLELYMEIEMLSITTAVRVEKFTSLPSNLVLNHWHLWHIMTVVQHQKKLIQNIRQYNCLFTFTSMGAHIDNSVNNGRGPPVFKISGQVHHRIGSLLPPDDGPPKFIQLYIYDTTNEVINRLKCLNADDAPNRSLDPSVVDGLMKMLDQHNPFVKKFRIARERLKDYPEEEFIIRIIGAKEGDPVQYNLPTTDDLAMLIIGDFSLDTFKRDIIIETRNKELKRISALHPAYMALQYPLLFPYGERGFQLGILYNGVVNTGEKKRVHKSGCT
jgi:hypothetical protein